MKGLFRFLVGLAFVLAAVALFMKARYGGPVVPFPDRSTPPHLKDAKLEVVATFDQAPGNIAVSADNRIFFTFHPEGRPSGDKLCELIDGKPIAFPSGGDQALFNTPLGVRLDSKGRLWVIDHGMHGLGGPRLIAIDIKTRAILTKYDFPHDVAGRGSFLQDLSVDPEGRFVYIADAGVMAKKPAIVVYDSVEKTSFRRLERHGSVMDKDYLVNAKGHAMILLGGLFNVHVALDSIALDRKGEWLYYGAMSNEDLYRVRVTDLHNNAVNDDELRRRVELFGPKVQTDGISIDNAGNIYLTDIEHGGIAILGADRKLQTLIIDPRIRWPDGLSFGPGGYLYISDSDLPDQMMRSRGTMKANAPYFIYRFQTGQSAPAGQ